MGKQNVAKVNFNVGVIDKKAMARFDINRGQLSAEIQDNWMPNTLGSMSLRPGTKYITGTYLDRATRYIPFIFSADDMALIELSNSNARFLVDDVVVGRDSVTTTITNGNFTNNITGWISTSESGAFVTYESGMMGLRGTGFNYAAAYQKITVLPENIGKEHGIRIKVARGKVKLRIGSDIADSPYYQELTLRTGLYSFSVVPTGDFFITFLNYERTQVLIDYVRMEAAGDVVLQTPWTDIDSIRTEQSGDVIFAACHNVRPMRIERYSARSWGIADYNSDDGAFLPVNTSKTKISIDSLNGNTIMRSSAALFKSGHVGTLFRSTSSGQNIVANISGDNQWSDPIRITGVGDSRRFTYSISGTWSAIQITLQRSIGDDQSWNDTGTVHTSNGNYFLNDTLDNQIIYYRLGVATGQFTSGTVNISISSPLGGITGIARITEYQNSQQVAVEVLKSFGSNIATDLWSEGRWSAYRGYPSAVCLFEGRLWWAGKDDIIGSVSDAYESFDDTIEGDSAPIIRSLGYGAVDKVSWLLSLQRLVIGTQSDERMARSSSLDEPLTVSNFSIKSPSSQGSANVAGVKLDSTGLFVDLSQGRLFQLSQGDNYDYVAVDLSLLVPELVKVGIKRIAIQKNPDSRIHCVLSDGKVAILTFDRGEDVKCWSTVRTHGQIEDVVILPSNSGDDNVYYVVKRAINYDGMPLDYSFAYTGEGRVPREIVFRNIGYTDAFGGGRADDWAIKLFGYSNVDYIVNSGLASGVGFEINPNELYYGNGRNIHEITIRSLGYIGALGQQKEIEWLWTQYGTRILDEVFTEEITYPYFGAGRNPTEIAIRYLGYSGEIQGYASHLLNAYGTDDIETAIYRVASLTNPNGNSINTATEYPDYLFKRHLEKFTSQEECIGGLVNKLCDSHIEFSSNVATKTITGLEHLNGHYVTAWGNKKYLGLYRVVSGSITVSENVTYAVVGLYYSAFYKSTKLAYAAALGTALGQRKKVAGVSLILKDTHAQGIKYGSTVDLQDMPLIEDADLVDQNKIWDEYDKERIPMPAEYNTDSRLYLAAYAPKPCTVLGAIVTVETNDKI